MDQHNVEQGSEQGSRRGGYDFGWYPELVGVAGVCLLIWCLIAFSRGGI